jgi:hypothetical protein
MFAEGPEASIAGYRRSPVCLGRAARNCRAGDGCSRGATMAISLFVGTSGNIVGCLSYGRSHRVAHDAVCARASTDAAERRTGVGCGARQGHRRAADGSLGGRNTPGAHPARHRRQGAPRHAAASPESGHDPHGHGRCLLSLLLAGWKVDRILYRKQAQKSLD